MKSKNSVEESGRKKEAAAGNELLRQSLSKTGIKAYSLIRPVQQNIPAFTFLLLYIFTAAAAPSLLL
ncbi:MAG: hypothetical protein M3R17_06030 [Bacteroidota bacterium]|nr:hypothetical protein [Bacteroidota bacterium]